MTSFICPFCSSSMALTDDTYFTSNPSFGRSATTLQIQRKEEIEVKFFKCPACAKISVSIYGRGEQFSDKEMWFYPNSTAKQFPDYIPQAIRQDYEEACAILSLSPKSSATLLRRCLQGMISDFWGINKNKLKDAIDELKGKIPAKQWDVIDGIRRIGNIGAHMEKDISLIVDIDAGETEKLIKLIELLLQQWYVERHNQEELYNDIIDIDKSKQAARKGE